MIGYTLGTRLLSAVLIGSSLFSTVPSTATSLTFTLDAENDTSAIVVTDDETEAIESEEEVVEEKGEEEEEYEIPDECYLTIKVASGIDSTFDLYTTYEPDDYDGEILQYGTSNYYLSEWEYEALDGTNDEGDYWISWTMPDGTSTETTCIIKETQEDGEIKYLGLISIPYITTSAPSNVYVGHWKQSGDSYAFLDASYAYDGSSLTFTSGEANDVGGLLGTLFATSVVANANSTETLEKDKQSGSNDTKALATGVSAFLNLKNAWTSFSNLIISKAFATLQDTYNYTSQPTTQKISTKSVVYQTKDEATIIVYDKSSTKYSSTHTYTLANNTSQIVFCADMNKSSPGSVGGHTAAEVSGSNANVYNVYEITASNFTTDKEKALLIAATLISDQNTTLYKTYHTQIFNTTVCGSKFKDSSYYCSNGEYARGHSLISYFFCGYAGAFNDLKTYAERAETKLSTLMEKDETFASIVYASKVYVAVSNGTRANGNTFTTASEVQEFAWAEESTGPSYTYSIESVSSSISSPTVTVTVQKRDTNGKAVSGAEITAYCNNTSTKKTTGTDGNVTFTWTSSDKTVTKQYVKVVNASTQATASYDDLTADQKSEISSSVYKTKELAQSAADAEIATYKNNCAKTVSFSETSTPYGYTTASPISATSYAVGTTNVTMTDGIRTGTITLTKSMESGYSLSASTSASTLYSLNGAVYHVYTTYDSANDSCSGKVGEITTSGDNHTGTLSGLAVPAGSGSITYYIREYTAPTGYEKDGTVYTVTFSSSDTNNLYTKTITVADTPKYASIQVVKHSGNTNATGQSNTSGQYSLSGATYKVYSDSTCKNEVTDINGKSFTLTTGTDGKTGTVNLPMGTYYVKETSASTGYNTCTENNDGYGAGVHEVTATTAGVTSTVSCSEPPKTSTLSLQKSSADTSTSQDSSYYDLAGAVYWAYVDEACTTRAKDVNGNYIVLTTDSDGNSNTVTVGLGIYYVKEQTKEGSTTASGAKGYNVCGEVHRINCSTAGSNNEVTCKDPIQYGYLALTKSSANTGITEGNNCYSLAGAVYYVYTDAACKTPAIDSDGCQVILTTDEDGVAHLKNEKAIHSDNATNTTVKIGMGTYYAKEVTASPGYYLCSESETDPATKKRLTGVHIVTVAVENQVATFTCKEVPTDDPFQLTLTKMDSVSGGLPTGTASLEGAVFQITYYDNTEGDTASSGLTRTWYFVTNAKGKFNMAAGIGYMESGSYIVQDGTSTKTVTYTSDDLYYDVDGAISYPLGTYLIKEVQAPQYYTLNGTFTFNGVTTKLEDGISIVLRQDTNSGTPVFYSVENGATTDLNKVSATNMAMDIPDEQPEFGSLTIYKYASDGKTPLAGVKFKLTGITDTTKVYEATTDENGKLVFSDLIPQSYTLIEEETVDGYSLLAEPITVQIPFEVTLTEVGEHSDLDLTQAKFDPNTETWCFYNQTYSVSNAVQFEMPVAGGNGVFILVMCAVGFIAMGIGLLYFATKRRKVQVR